MKIKLEEFTLKKRFLISVAMAFFIIFFLSSNMVEIYTGLAKDLKNSAKVNAKKTCFSLGESTGDNNVVDMEATCLVTYAQGIRVGLASKAKESVTVSIYTNGELIGEGVIPRNDQEVTIFVHRTVEQIVVKLAKNESVEDTIQIALIEANNTVYSPISYIKYRLTTYYYNNLMGVFKQILVFLMLCLAITTLFQIFSPLKLKKKLVRIGVIGIEQILLIGIGICAINYMRYPAFTVLIIIVGILLMLLLGISYFMIFEQKKNIYWIYPVVGGFLGLVFLLIMPIYTVPDENVHICMAYELSNWIMGVENPMDGRCDDVLYMRQEDAELPIIEQHYSLKNYDDYCASIFRFSEKNNVILVERDTIASWHILYVFPALGITLGRLLGLGAVATLLLGRLANLAFFLMMTSYAIKIIPEFKMVLVSLALLPMTLQQTMSYSYDTAIISTTFLLVALTLKIYYVADNGVCKKDSIKTRDYILLAVCCILMTVVKGHAYFLTAFFPLIAWEKQKEKKDKCWLAGIVGFSLLVLVLTVVFQSQIFPFETEIQEGYENYIEWADNEGYTIKMILDNPAVIPELAINTVRENGYFYALSFVGNNLGWIEIVFSKKCEFLLYMFVIFACIPRKNRNIHFSRKNTVGIWGIGLFEVTFVFAGMLLGWTPITKKVIQGVQGRYFLPIAPMLMMTFDFNKFRISEDRDGEALFLQIFTVSIIAILVITRL